MIVLDIESSGLDSGKCGIWQIGALELENPKNYFLEEARIDDEDEVTESALKVIGKSEEELRDRKKQSQRQLILNYIKWLSPVREKLFMGQNIGWDISFIQNKCMRYGVMDKFREVQSQRAFDLHTIAQERYKAIKGFYLFDEKGKSKMNLTAILEFCGLPDERILMNGNKIEKQGKSHNALDDCKLEGECFSRLVYGKNIFPEFSQYKIPEVLRK
jgi:DNA polymerase III epsilon subunit-like protein